MYWKVIYLLWLLLTLVLEGDQRRVSKLLGRPNCHLQSIVVVVIVYDLVEQNHELRISKLTHFVVKVQSVNMACIVGTHGRFAIGSCPFCIDIALIFLKMSTLCLFGRDYSSAVLNISSKTCGMDMLTLRRCHPWTQCCPCTRSLKPSTGVLPSFLIGTKGNGMLLSQT